MLGSRFGGRVPVTAKLSRKFYERFGDDITTELVDWFNAVDETYRNQLKEINELNWERFKAHLDARMAELRAEMAALASGLREESRDGLSGLRKESHDGLSALRKELGDEIRRSHDDLLKWMFIYWSGSIVTLGGFLFAAWRYTQH
jgi:hypothetical protein